MKKQLLTLLSASILLVNFNAKSQSTWDDFDNAGAVVYPFINGVVFNQSFTNPSTTGVNTSAICAQYQRNSGAQYDVMLLEPIGLTKVASVAAYAAGTKSMTIKIYSPAVGKTVQITLEDKNIATPTNYPLGRHSEYTAVTTVANSWETLTFVLAGTPDTNLTDTTVNRLVILLDPNTFNSDTYLLDDIMGPDLINPCLGVTPDVSIADDYECQRNVTFDFANGTHLQNVTNPLTTGINSSNTCGKFFKFIPPTNDGAFGGTLLNPFNSSTYNLAHIELYSPAGAYDFKMVFQDASGTDILDTLFVTSSTPGWSKFDMDLSKVPTSTSIEKFVFLLNSPTSTEDSIFLDNFSFSFDPFVSINENDALNAISVYPNPFEGEIRLSSEVSFDEVIITDITGKIIKTISNINSNELIINTDTFNSGIYLLKISDQSGNYRTEKIIKNSK